MARTELAGCHVVVTRPREQSQQLIRWIQELGGEVLEFPVLATRAVTDPPPPAASLADLSTFDLVIFVSANAVRHYVPGILEQGPWPARSRIGAVGAATARALAAAGLTADLVPEAEFTSEGLLALPALAAVPGKRILIVRGEGGRETLAETLRQRGAEVGYAEVYRRCLPETDAAPLAEWLEVHRDDFIVVTSAEGLHNLFALMGPRWRDALRHARYILFSRRLAAAGRDLGIVSEPIVTRIASDKGIIDALVDNFTPRESTGTDQDQARE